MWQILEKGTSRRFLHTPDALLFPKYLLSCPTAYGSSGDFTNHKSSHPEASEKLFWKIKENSQENIHGGVVFLTLANKKLYCRLFPGNFLKHFRLAISKNTHGLLLLRLSGKVVVTVFSLQKQSLGSARQLLWKIWRFPVNFLKCWEFFWSNFEKVAPFSTTSLQVFWPNLWDFITSKSIYCTNCSNKFLLQKTDVSMVISSSIRHRFNNVEIISIVLLGL